MAINIEALEAIAKRVRETSPDKDRRAASFFYMLMGWIGEPDSTRIEHILFNNNKASES